MAEQVSAGRNRRIFYGINPTTFEVESVSRTRGGELHKWAKNGQLVTHAIHPSNRNDPRTEVIVVWHLTDVISFPAYMYDADAKKAAVAELERKAAEKRSATTS